MAITIWHQGKVVGRLISAYPGLNLNLGLLFFFTKAFTQITFYILFRASNHQNVDKKITLNLHFELSYLNPNFALTLVYLSWLKNNLARMIITARGISSYRYMHWLITIQLKRYFWCCALLWQLCRMVFMWWYYNMDREKSFGPRVLAVSYTAII